MAWTDFIEPVLQAGGAYLQYNDKKNRQADLERNYQAYLSAKEQQAAAQAANRGGGGGGGGGGGNKTAAALMMEEYLRKAQARYEPYLKAANDILPQQTALYGAALPGAQNFAVSALSPEVVADVMRYDRPQQAALPEYLYGGKK